MSVKIYDVEKNCKFAKKGITAGYELVSVNGNQINDVLDYRFYCDDKKLKFEFFSPEGKKKKVVLRNVSDCDSNGLEFETYLMDKHRRCKNSCIFCFIDQLPPGLRGSLYFKDDDSRLSFLFGNYITLTNLTDEDVERIIKMHISPINASVHTMNPELRVRMMKNPFAGESLNYLRRFSDAGISINAQLVLCPGINDGDELSYSLEKLSELDSVASIAAVPVGLTKYRDNLEKLSPYDRDSASAVIDSIDKFNDARLISGKNRLAFAADEFYQIACRDFPEYDYYGDFPQLDNGVGLYVSTEKEFLDAMDDTDADNNSREFAFATGVAAYPLLKSLSDHFCEKFSNASISAYKINNSFFGDNVTVAGLITGRDLIDTLKKENFSSPVLLLPSVMLKSDTERIFLDDVDVREVEAELNTKVIVTPSDGAMLFDLFYKIN